METQKIDFLFKKGGNWILTFILTCEVLSRKEIALHSFENISSTLANDVVWTLFFFLNLISGYHGSIDSCWWFLPFASDQHRGGSPIKSCQSKCFFFLKTLQRKDKNSIKELHQFFLEVRWERSLLDFPGVNHSSCILLSHCYIKHKIYDLYESRINFGNKNGLFYNKNMWSILAILTKTTFKLIYCYILQPFNLNPSSVAV